MIYRLYCTCMSWPIWPLGVYVILAIITTSLWTWHLCNIYNDQWPVNIISMLYCLPWPMVFEHNIYVILSITHQWPLDMISLYNATHWGNPDTVNDKINVLDLQMTTLSMRHDQQDLSRSSSIHDQQSSAPGLKNCCTLSSSIDNGWWCQEKQCLGHTDTHMMDAIGENWWIDYCNCSGSRPWVFLAITILNEFNR